MGSKGCVDAKPELKVNIFRHIRYSFNGVQEPCECLFLGEGEMIRSQSESYLLTLGLTLLSSSDGRLLAVLQSKRCGLVLNKILVFFTMESYKGQEPTANDIRTCDCDLPLYLRATIEIKGLFRPRASYRLVTGGGSGDGKPVLSEPSEKKSKVTFKIVAETTDGGTVAKLIELD
jgi:hypothetical protein